MAANAVNLEVAYQDLLAEHKASQQQVHSKGEALKIFQKQLKESSLHKQRLEQEIKQLHSQLARVQMQSTTSSTKNVHSSAALLSHQSPIELRTSTFDTEREKDILQLELAQEKNSELSRQIQLLEDEKEELAGERDYYSGKCTNLVKCLEEERQAKPPSHSALQNVMEENRQLRLALIDMQAERDQALHRIERYKRAVERRKAREVSSEKALQFAMGNKKQDMQLSLRRINELETIGNNLSESVKEKTIALSHQKKANKMLASRIAELEHRLKVLEISGLWSSSDCVEQIPSIPDIPLSPDRLLLTCSREETGNTSKSDDCIPPISDNNPFSELKDKEVQDRRSEQDQFSGDEHQDGAYLA